MKQFKKFFTSSIFLVILFFTFSAVAHAKESGINSIDVAVTLYPDGSADITEIWDINNVYEGTEYYKALYNLKGMTVSDFTVTDDTNKVYTAVSSWDVDASFAEKAYTCSILEVNKGYELCWGISQMGDRTYTISYHLTGLVKKYKDGTGFYHQFISDELSSPPNSASVSIVMPDKKLSMENTDMRAFGYNGYLYWEDGMIIASTKKLLKDSGYINIMVEFDDSVFPTDSGSLVLTKGSFQFFKIRAQYSKFIPIIIIIPCLIILALCIYQSLKYYNLADGTKVLRVFSSKAEEVSFVSFMSSIPMISATSGLEYQMPVMHPISAYIMKWQIDQVISFDESTLILNKEPIGDKIETSLYRIFRIASTDNILTLSAWKKWLKKNSESLVSWKKRFNAFGLSELEANGWIKYNKHRTYRFTASGYDMYIKLLGFYKHLKSFKHSSNNTVADREYWGDYLIYASLFGLSKGVTDGLMEADSEGFDEYCSYYGMNNMIFIHSMHYGESFSSAVSSAVSSDDGSSSFGSGGGGFSGGGGGGSR